VHQGLLTSAQEIAVLPTAQSELQAPASTDKKDETWGE
jgi:hypothetical protein